MTATRFLPVLALAVTSLAAPFPAAANPIERACNSSDRPAVTRSLCSCIGSAAERTLSRSQMREGARMFRIVTMKLIAPKIEAIPAVCSDRMSRSIDGPACPAVLDNGG